MLERIIIDLCAALLAEELKLSLLVSQAEKDGLAVYCFAPLPRENMRRALRVHGILEHFDSLLHEDILNEMLPEELRALDDKDRTYWIRFPADVDYRPILKKLSPRKRSLPRALHLLGKPLEEDGILGAGDNSQQETE